ncbi:MAG TPA: MerR family transcriptional regulator [Thermomicrobiales bacterium]|nr:MerR family transcriptional regulator [Thermomicrobiales bacterium]
MMTATVDTVREEETDAALWPIGQVAREVGLTARAIRYYQEYGLLRPAVSVKGAGRLFDASDVQRLREIKRLREDVGFSLAEIAELLDTDDTRARLRQRFHGTTDTGVRETVLREAIALAEQRLALIERKLTLVAAVRDEEAARLGQLREALAAAATATKPEAQEGKGTDGDNA